MRNSKVKKLRRAFDKRMHELGIRKLPMRGAYNSIGQLVHVHQAMWRRFKKAFIA